MEFYIILVDLRPKGMKKAEFLSPALEADDMYESLFDLEFVLVVFIFR